MKTKTVKTSTLKGLKRAEWYQAHGWRAVSINPITDVITFTKTSPREDRIAELIELRNEFILNESVFADDSPSWGEVADAQAEAERKWNETDEGNELRELEK